MRDHQGGPARVGAEVDLQRLDTAADEAGADPAAQLAAWVDAAFAHYPDDIALHDV